MAVAVYDNMAAEDPRDVKDSFVVGIVDDVGFSHLTPGDELEDAVPESTTECLFWWVGGRAGLRGWGVCRALVEGRSRCSGETAAAAGSSSLKRQIQQRRNTQNGRLNERNDP